jgi:O-antigen/teichoic acid export membrane protein
MIRRLIVHQGIAHLGGRGTMLAVHLLLPVLLGWDEFTRLMVPWVWLVLLVQPLCDGGLDPLVSREVAQDNPAAAGRIQSLRLMLAAAAIVLTLALTAAGQFAYGLGLALATWFVCLALSQTLIAILRGQERMGFEAIILPISRLGLLAALAAGYLNGSLTASTAAFTFALTGVITLLAVAIVVGRMAGARTLIPRSDALAPLARAAVPMLVITGAGMLYLRVDSVMLSIMLDEASMAAYQPAKRLVEAAFALPSIFVIALFPSLSRSGAAIYPRVRRYAARMMILGTGVLIVLVAGGGAVLWYLYGAEGTPSRTALYVLAFSVPLVFVGTLLTQYLVALGHQAQYAWAGVAALVLNIALNYWFIPRFGIVGAAATTVATELFVVVASAWLIHRAVWPSLATHAA